MKTLFLLTLLLVGTAINAVDHAHSQGETDNNIQPHTLRIIPRP